MKFLDIGNIVLTKGESSDVYEITSDSSLADYKGFLRISDAKGVKHEEELKHSKEVKNDDNIFNDDLVINYMAEKFDFNGNIYDDTQPNEDVFSYQIRINDIKKDELHEKATITGRVYTTTTQDTLDDRASGGEVLVSRAIETGIENAQVTVALTSELKEITREGRGLTNHDGDFSIEIHLGASTKYEKSRAIIFEISNAVTEKLDAGRYYCTVTIKKEELDKSISFQKEILQTKLDINEKN